MMAVRLKSTSPFPDWEPARWALLLLAAVLAGAAAKCHEATLSRCQQAFDYRRVLTAGRDDSIITLNLVKCRLKQGEFELIAFGGAILPNLEEILLTYNRFEHLSPGVFGPVANVTILDLHHNKLLEVPVCDAPSPLPRLTKLDLSSNRIATIIKETFSYCVKLRQLNLEHNVITFVHPEAFLQLTYLRELSLNGNYITSVTDTMFNIRSLQSLHLEYNFIEYVSPRAFTGTGLSTLKLYRNRLSFLPSRFASKLNSAGGHVTALEVHGNPWHCACLLEHLADVKAAAVEYYSAQWFSAGAPACVFAGRRACHRDAPSPLLPPPASPGAESAGAVH